MCKMNPRYLVSESNTVFNAEMKEVMAARRQEEGTGVKGTPLAKAGTV